MKNITCSLLKLYIVSKLSKTFLRRSNKYVYKLELLYYKYKQFIIK